MVKTQRADAPAEPPAANTRITLLWQAVATALVRHLDLHEGYWRVELHPGASIPMQANIGDPTGQHQYPAVILPMTRLTLVRVAQLSDTSVDAAVVNPDLSKHQHLSDVTH